jgi:hypothetical protein
VLENLEPAPQVKMKHQVRASVEFDGNLGEATTQGYESEPENFDEFLLDAGLNPEDIDVIPPVRTSRWQRYDGEWLTSYRFMFRKKKSNVDLPKLIADSDKKYKQKKLGKPYPRALVVLWSDLQVGKLDKLGGTDALIERVNQARDSLITKIMEDKPSKCIFVDLGDTIEGFENKASAQQLYSNDLSLHDQVDLATTMAWRTIKTISENVPEVIYASVGSNHCQWRQNGQKIGKATDDWAVFIGRQLARLASESGAKNIRFIEPQPDDESLAVDVFEDQYHILGIVHGHQASRPEQISTWFRGQAFGRQPVSHATTLVHGHFHHLRIQELGMTEEGYSRFIVGAPTLDNGSSWFRNTTGESATPGLAVFVLEESKPFTGTVWKL